MTWGILSGAGRLSASKPELFLDFEIRELQAQRQRRRQEAMNLFWGPLKAKEASQGSGQLD